MRFLTLDFGRFMMLMGESRRARQYRIGNPLIAITMAKHNIGAALNVPIRILVYETDTGEVRIAHDKTSTLITRLGNADLNEAAEMLDAELANFLTGVAGTSA